MSRAETWGLALCFRRSLATAAFSQEIARIRRLNVEDAFLCGLLHDVGRPILLQALVNCRNCGQADGTDEELLLASEDQRIPMAGRLVQSWELPERLSETIEHQQIPASAPTCQKQAAILNLAIDLAALALDPAAETSISGDFSHTMMAVLNLYPEEFSGIWQQRAAVLDWVGASA